MFTLIKKGFREIIRFDCKECNEIWETDVYKTHKEVSFPIQYMSICATCGERSFRNV